MKRRPYPPLGGKELSSKHETGRGDVGGKKLSHCPFVLSPLSPPSLYPVFTTASQASSSLQARKTNTVLFLTATKILDICIFFSVKKTHYTCVVRLKADRHEGFCSRVLLQGHVPAKSRTPPCVPKISWT